MTANERFDRPQWPLTAYSLVATRPSRGGDVGVDWAEEAEVQCESLKSKKYYLRDHFYLR